MEDKSETSISFVYQCSGNFRKHFVGINSHFRNSIEHGFLDGDKLWFSQYLKTHPTEDDVDLAEVSVLFRINRRAETLCLNYLQANMPTIQLATGGRATHIVDKVIYGAEIILSIKRDVILRRETKENVEDDIYEAAVTYFNEAINTDWSQLKLPPPLENVSCTIFSSIDLNIINRNSFIQTSNWLRDTIKDPDNQWRPVDVVLHRLPELKARCSCHSKEY